MQEKDLQPLNLDAEQIATVLGLIDGSIAPDTIEKTQQWIRQCYHYPPDSETIMHAIDATIGTHGVECLGPEIDLRFTPAYSYCNAGDVYVATIIQDNDTGRIFVGSYSDIVDLLEKDNDLEEA